MCARVAMVVVSVPAVTALANECFYDKENLMTDLTFEHVLSSLVYGLIGMGLFVFTLFVLEWIRPFPLEKKIVEENNTAVAIVVAAVIIALGMIYSSAIR